MMFRKTVSSENRSPQVMYSTCLAVVGFLKDWGIIFRYQCELKSDAYFLIILLCCSEFCCSKCPGSVVCLSTRWINDDKTLFCSTFHVKKILLRGSGWKAFLTSALYGDEWPASFWSCFAFGKGASGILDIKLSGSQHRSGPGNEKVISNQLQTSYWYCWW